jgi:hypothetical protein
MRTPSAVISITPTSNVDAHATGDVIAAPEELVNFAAEDGRGVRIESVVVIDEGDVGGAMDLVFLSESGSIGAESAAYTMTDVVALTCLGTINILAAEFDDSVNNKIATHIVNGGLIIHPAAGSTSVWMGLVARGNIDLTAADDITIKIGRSFV